MGDPREPTDPRIIEALREGVRERMGYPAAVGLPELREAVAGWAGRGSASSRSRRHVIPTLGSKEAIFSFAHVVLDVAGGRDTVVVTEPGYPVGVRGAQFAGARVVELPLLEENGFLPDLDAVPRRDVATNGAHVAQLPEQPHRGGGAARLLRGAGGPRPRVRLRARLRRGVQGALVRGATGLRAAARRLDERRGLQHALEALLDDRLPLGLRRRRPRTDRGATAVPAQRRHRATGVRPARLGRRLGGRGARRARARGVRAQADALPRPVRARRPSQAGGPATMYLWVAVPDGETSEGFATRLLEQASSSHPAPSSGRRARATSASPSSRRTRSASGPSSSSASVL